MYFEQVDEIQQIEVIASDKSIPRLGVLEEAYGSGRWRQLEGVARIPACRCWYSFGRGSWYEARGIGRKRLRISVSWTNVASSSQLLLCAANEGAEDLPGNGWRR